MSKALKILNRIKQNSSLKDFSKSSHDIITYNFLKNEDFVVDSLPSGRLVCMINDGVNFNRHNFRIVT